MRVLSLIGIFWLIINSYAESQIYLHPTVGIASENVGSCLASSCAGTYYDDGGAAGNYSTNIAGTYRVFCPAVAGQCVTATFTVFDIAPNGACADLLAVLNGSTQNSPVMFASCGNAVLPGPFTGTNNGCLGFRFWSNASITSLGWAATIGCVNCANGPTGTGNTDCVNATEVCATTTVSGNSTGPGLVAEACGGGGCPAGGENYSNWYKLTVVNGGTLTFTITPSVATDDYDYAVYGPGTACGALGPAIRCSDAQLTGATGLSAAAVDLTENVLGDKFTAPLNVSTGEVYYLMVDEWTPTGAGYSLTLGGTASLGCILTPVEYLSFDAQYNLLKQVVDLDWETSSETNNDYFEVQRSTDGGLFDPIGRVNGAGTSSVKQSYHFVDEHPFPGEINYYRLKQVDFNGHYKYSDLRAVLISDPSAQFSTFPNPADVMSTISYVTAQTFSMCHVKIYDAMAKLILSFPFMPERGTNQIPLDLSGFSKGVYFITLSANGELFKTSLVKE